MSKHTPGPWKVDAMGNAFSIRPAADKETREDGMVGHTHKPIVKSPNDCTFGWEDGEHMGNACLIAAAPELLEMLKQCAHAMSCNAPYGQPEKLPTLYAMKRAIAKAEGHNE